MIALVKLYNGEHFLVRVDGEVVADAWRWDAFRKWQHMTTVDLSRLRVLFGRQSACRWCVKGTRPDGKAPCVHCKGTGTENQKWFVELGFYGTSFAGEHLTGWNEKSFLFAHGNPMAPLRADHTKKAVEDAEIEAAARRQEERDRVTDDHPNHP